MDFTGQFSEMMRHFSTTGGFLTAKSAKGVNTMTIAWGFVGFMWSKPHFLTVVRPQRYTRQILDAADSFTVSVPFDSMREALRICGTQSGADIDKSEIVTFVPAKCVESPIVLGCDLYYECAVRNMSRLDGQRMDEDVRKHYPAADYHDLFFGEIVACYSKLEADHV